MTTLPNYNGWVNFGTWAAYTWLSDDEGHWAEVEAIVEQSPTQYAVQKKLREYVSELCSVEEASLHADLIEWAIGLIDWGELVEACIEAFEPDEENDEDDETGT